MRVFFYPPCCTCIFAASERIGIFGNLPYIINNEEYAISNTIPRNRKLANIEPIILSRSTTGKKVKMTPKQEQIIFNKIACITLNRKNFVNGTDPFEHIMKIQTIKKCWGKLSNR